jgi:hypothetical protein
MEIQIREILDDIRAVPTELAPYGEQFATHIAAIPLLSPPPVN